MTEIQDAEITITGHVWIVRSGEFRSVADAARVKAQIDAACPEGFTILYVTGPPGGVSTRRSSDRTAG